MSAMDADPYEGHAAFWPPRSSRVTKDERAWRLAWRWWCMNGRHTRYIHEKRGWRGYARTLEERGRDA